MSTVPHFWAHRCEACKTNVAGYVHNGDRMGVPKKYYARICAFAKHAEAAKKWIPF
jgi:hypothetical protein